MSADTLIERIIHSANLSSPHTDKKPLSSSHVSGSDSNAVNDDFLDNLFKNGFIEEASEKLEKAISSEIVSY